MKTSNKMVSRPQLKIKVDTFIAEAELKFEDLNRQDAFKRQLFEYGLVVAEGGSNIAEGWRNRDDIYRSFETK